MPFKACWAYDFTSARSLEEMHAVFNEAGPWQWTMRDSAWYGDYLNTRPEEDARVRVHEYPQEGSAGTFVGLRDQGFSSLLQIEAASPAAREELDRIFQGLLRRVDATNLTEIEPYD